MASTRGFSKQNADCSSASFIAAERFLAPLLEKTLGVLALVTTGGVISHVMGSVESALGRSPQDVTGRSMFDLVHIEDLNVITTALSDCLNDGFHPHTAALRLQHQNGSFRHVEATLLKLEADAGIPTVAVAIRDLTTVKETERNLCECEKRFRLMAQLSSDVLWDWDLVKGEMWTADGSGRFFESGWRQVPGGLGGWVDMLHPDDKDRVVSELEKFVEHGRGTWCSEYRIRCQEGCYVLASDRGVLISEDAGHAIRMVGALRDLSRTLALQEQLMQAQKMEAIGRLAGGIAHDFNNLLTGINIQAGLLLDRVKRDANARAHVEQLLGATESGATLVQQLLAFSREQAAQPQVTDLSGILRRLHPMIQRMVGEDVQLTVITPASGGLVRIDPIQFEQLILNLTVNARDAMPKGGLMTISTTVVGGVRESQRCGRSNDSPRWVLLTVTDTGCGMPPEVKARAFDPFFTTKPEGKGTGLGLSITYGVVEQSGGYVELESLVGRGTEFRIYLPLVDEMADTTHPPDKPVVELRGSETIIVAEDDALVRASVSSWLEANGYHVLIASNAPEALEIVSGFHGEVGLLVTDIMMPGVSGLDLAESIKAIHPRIAVLYVSGHPPQAFMDDRLSAGSSAFLVKPFTVEALGQQVRALLDSLTK